MVKVELNSDEPNAGLDENEAMLPRFKHDLDAFVETMKFYKISKVEIEIEDVEWL